MSTNFFKSLLISSAVVGAFVVTGCASKPQVTSRSAGVSPEFYVVRAGDTLSKIGSRYGMSYQTLAALNDIAPPYNIYVGQTIRIKQSTNVTKTTTQPLQTIEPIQRQTVTTAPTVTQPKITTTPSSQQTNILPTSSLKWTAPSNNSVIAPFNLQQNVRGLRYGGQIGDPIFAAANGQVVYAADGLKEYGKLILIKHTDGYITAYAHNDKLLVKSGENVIGGQKIAEMGSTGATQPMLEFQIRHNGKPVDPSDILPKK